MLTGLAGLAGKAKFLLNDNSTTILSGVAVGGTAITAYLTGRATVKATRIIDREQQLVGAEKEVESRQTKELTRFDKVKLVWRHYIPPFVSGVTTITCIIVANKIASKKIAALAISSALSERALQEYKAKVIEKLGEKKDQEIRDDVARDRVKNQPVQSGEVILVGTGEVLFFDMTSGRYFQSTVEEVKKAVNRTNHDLNNQMYASLSQFYEEIGLPPTTYSDMVGWNANTLMDVEISATKSSDDRPCLAIDFVPAPFAEYDRLHDQ
jgi:Family of unknown function (DUF6353)